MREHLKIPRKCPRGATATATTTAAATSPPAPAASQVPATLLVVVLLGGEGVPGKKNFVYQRLLCGVVRGAGISNRRTASKHLEFWLPKRPWAATKDLRA